MFGESQFMSGFDSVVLNVLFRIEPGCLGPSGKEHVEAFCSFVDDALNAPAFAAYTIVPRYDKSLPEWEYSVRGKRLGDEQVNTLLERFGTNTGDFETHFEDALTDAIDRFFSR